MNLWKRGSIDNDALFIIVIVGLLILSWVNIGLTKKSGGSVNPFSIAIPVPTSGGVISSGGSGVSSSRDGTSIIQGPDSPYTDLVSIGVGNGSSEYQPSREYIVLYGSGSIENPINVTGWYLTNGKGARTYQVGSATTRFASDKVIIPEGKTLFNPNGGGASGPVLLAPYGEVILTTGSVNYKSKQLPAFRENKCSGYLVRDQKDKLTLNPGVNTFCPAPTKEIGVSNLDRACRQFIENMNSCRTPNYIDSVIDRGTVQSGYVDGVAGLSDQCKTFLQSHYSYNSCVANHSQDSNFYTNTWRVFFNRPFELWATDYEIITLYDREGRIVDQYQY